MCCIDELRFLNDLNLREFGKCINLDVVGCQLLELRILAQLTCLEPVWMPC